MRYLLSSFCSLQLFICSYFHCSYLLRRSLAAHPARRVHLTVGIHWAAQRHYNEKGPSEIRVLANIEHIVWLISLMLLGNRFISASLRINIYCKDANNNTARLIFFGPHYKFPFTIFLT